MYSQLFIFPVTGPSGLLWNHLLKSVSLKQAIYENGEKSGNLSDALPSAKILNYLRYSLKNLKKKTNFPHVEYINMRLLTRSPILRNFQKVSTFAVKKKKKKKMLSLWHLLLHSQAVFFRLQNRTKSFTNIFFLFFENFLHNSKFVKNSKFVEKFKIHKKIQFFLNFANRSRFEKSAYRVKTCANVSTISQPAIADREYDLPHADAPLQLSTDG